jgi:hypothetical protein
MTERMLNLIDEHTRRACWYVSSDDGAASDLSSGVLYLDSSQIRNVLWAISYTILDGGGFMNISDIVVAIDTEIAQLQKVKTLLSDASTTAKRKPGRPIRVTSPNKATSFNPVEFAGKPEKRRTMSAEGRAKIGAAQRARWAKFKRAAKRATPKAASAPAKKVARKTGSPKKAVALKKSAQPKAETAVTAAS